MKFRPLLDVDEPLLNQEEYSRSDLIKVAELKNAKGEFVLHSYDTAYLIVSLCEESFAQLEKCF